MWAKKGERGEGKGKGGPRQQDMGAIYCECPKCSYKTKHDKGIPCSSKSCPKCNIPLVGK